LKLGEYRPIKLHQLSLVTHSGTGQSLEYDEACYGRLKQRQNANHPGTRGNMMLRAGPR